MLDIDVAFSGSYLASDVNFLLTVVNKDMLADPDSQDLGKKEALIQSGQAHYSDMLTLEQAPTPTHRALYQQALTQGKERFAQELLMLAKALAGKFSTFKLSQDKPLVMISLVRAGVPIGVLLQRLFAHFLVLGDSGFGLPSVHYGVSIIRDRGIDRVALQAILDKHPDSPVIFIDGWTGKGAIYGELQTSLKPFSLPTSPHFSQIFHQKGVCNSIQTDDLTIALVTLADPAGVAWLCASEEDWLIPSGLLNSTVSGLISRSLFSQEGLHRCVYYSELEKVDESLILIDVILQAALAMIQDIAIMGKNVRLKPALFKSTPNYRTQSLVVALAKKYHIQNLNRIKPTIAEATRAVLRREPECVLLQTPDHPDTALLRYLCQQKNVAITVVGEAIAPYQAVTLIKKKA